MLKRYANKRNTLKQWFYSLLYGMIIVLNAASGTAGDMLIACENFVDFRNLWTRAKKTTRIIHIYDQFEIYMDGASIT